MTNRKLAYIVKDQKPLVLATRETVQQACRCMWERRAGSVLVTEDQQRLSGILRCARWPRARMPQKPLWPKR